MTRIVFSPGQTGDDGVLIGWSTQLAAVDGFSVEFVADATNVDASRPAVGISIGGMGLDRLAAIPASRRLLLLLTWRDIDRSEVQEHLLARRPVVTATPWLRDAVVRHYGYSPETVAVVACAVPGGSPPAAEGSTTGVGGERRIVLDVRGATGHSRHGRDLITRALDSLATSHIVVTDDAATPTTSTRASVVRATTWADVHAVMSSASLVIQPSTFSDPRPLQAMVAGAAVLAWDAPGTSTYVCHGYNGWLVSMNDGAATVQALTALLADSANLRRLCDGARATAAAWPRWHELAKELEWAVRRVANALDTPPAPTVGRITFDAKTLVPPVRPSMPRPDGGPAPAESKTTRARPRTLRTAMKVLTGLVNAIREAPQTQLVKKELTERLKQRKRAQHPVNALQTHMSFAGVRRVDGDFSHEAPAAHLLYGFSKNPNGLEAIAGHNRRRTSARHTFSGPMRIAWVHPMFGVGGGGHHNIFRCQKFLQRDFGIESANFLYATPDSDLSRDKLSDELSQLAAKHYDYCGSPFVMDWNRLTDYPIHMATTWASTYPLLSADPLLRAYFIQDYEPYFFPNGGKRYLAERSYDFGYFPICAGPWLPQRIGYVPGGQREQDHCTYNLAVTHDDYFPSAAPATSRQGVCFYVRASTERRGFDLALMTIEVLQRDYPHIPIATVGMHAPELHQVTGCKHLGIKAVSQLQQVYSAYAAYVVFSFTNYSLLPAEIIACGGHVIDLDIPSNQASAALFSSEHYELCEPDPYRLAECVAARIVAVHASAEVAPPVSATWEDEYAKVGRALLDQFGRRR
ncbi:MAG: glycosyltransferase [Kofleriaceae bacterium]|nr:glycosyltransferase [Kofleriaceae bacterium]